MDCAHGAAVSRIQPAVSTLRSTRPLSFQTQESEMEVLKTHRTSGVQPHTATRSTDTRARGVHIHPADEAREIHARIPRAIDTHTSFQHCWSPRTGSRQQHVEVSTRYIYRHRAKSASHARRRTSTPAGYKRKNIHPDVSPRIVRTHRAAADLPLAVYPLTPTVASTSYTDPIVSHRLRTSTRTGMYPIHARPADVSWRRETSTSVARPAQAPLAESPCASPITLSPAPHQTCRALREYLQLATHPPPSRARSPTPHSAPGPTAARLQ
ncbi:hypothetical protein B0H13DRAFT_552228 [Mycena leptocephala]|nr:hypothetical protein B0H13DRAFT_552228 [Mycena leptocephala]